MTGHSSNSNGTGRKQRVFVAGALGAVGSLVADLLNSHPEVDLGAITARDTKDADSPIGKKLYEVYSEHRVNLSLQEIEDLDISSFDAAIVAYPAGAASQLARKLREAELTVIDSCADFRFRDLSTYEASYGPHVEPSLLSEAVYGLPELHRDRLQGARLIGNPGCYPTASLLALAPLARQGLIDDVVIDAKSGVSGAGKRGESAPPFVGTFDNMRPYGVPGHRHEPEIEEQLSFLDYGGRLTFVPHLVPLDQGELVSCYVTPSRRVDQAELDEIYAESYALEPFVELAPELPSARSVQRTNLCSLYPVVDHDGSRIFVFATIDNLWKGGASQAVQNLNLALGLPEGTGISQSLSVESKRAEDESALDRFTVSA